MALFTPRMLSVDVLFVPPFWRNRGEMWSLLRSQFCALCSRWTFEQKNQWCWFDDCDWLWRSATHIHISYSWHMFYMCRIVKCISMHVFCVSMVRNAFNLSHNPMQNDCQPLKTIRNDKQMLSKCIKIKQTKYKRYLNTLGHNRQLTGYDDCMCPTPTNIYEHPLTTVGNN